MAVTALIRDDLDDGSVRIQSVPILATPSFQMYLPPEYTHLWLHYCWRGFLAANLRDAHAAHEASSF